jgi:RHS repeat-associated protein
MSGSRFSGASPDAGRTLTTEFAYNGDGVRISKTVAGDTTQYVLDLAATLPVVISDTEAVYLYGLDIIAQQQSERLYYVHDGLGSVRQLVDTTGQIETNYAYDPFGVPLVGGEVYNPYQFSGEAWDAEVELLYLRARYYQPEVGRFVTKDPWEGDVWRPGTLNRYVYVHNSPANCEDPSGLQEQEGTYSSYESYLQATELVSAWYNEEGDVHVRLGPGEPLTQDVKHSLGVQQFKELWREDGGYSVPWAWTGHSVDVRTGYWLPVRIAWGVARALRAHRRLGMCSRPWASTRIPVESQNDPVDSTLGSLDEISVHLDGTHRLVFEVFNKMGWASGSRIPGTDWSLRQDRPRGTSESGGDFYMVFYWFESRDDYPLLRIRPESEVLSRVWRYRWE